jgi:predicted dinucleotide-binding enzyme
VPHGRSSATIAILGSGTLGEHTLALLLEDEGYAARLLKAPPTAATTKVLLPEAEGGSVEGLLEDVDIVLLWPTPTLRDDAREAFVGAMRSACATAKIPVLALSPIMAVASKDELAVEVPLMRQFEQLMWIIKAVLGSPAGSVTFLDLAALARCA